MPRLWSFLAFFVTLSLIDGALHFYFWVRLVRDPAWPPPFDRVGTVLIVLLAVLLPLGLFAGRVLDQRYGRVVSLAAFVWMGTAFLFFAILAFSDLIRLLSGLGAAAIAYLKSSPPAGSDVDGLMRREVMARGIAGAATAASGALSIVAARSALGELSVEEVNVKLEKLPKELDGLSIVQLTDVHVGPTIGKKFIEGMVEKANRARPDAVVITGDLVDGSVEELFEHVAPLSRLSARYGVYFVTGNHEYYSGATRWVEALQRLGIRVLRNERVTLGDSAKLELAGVDDASAARMGVGHGADLKRALNGRQAEREVVLLAHQPKAVQEASEHDVGLVLSGHTHGGQIFPWGALVGLTQPYVVGLHRHTQSTQIYVSKGTGYWGPPMRLLAPAEITRIVLSSG
ncbi:MAG: metallophosphoesterase [Deltaproteobacteria bacterium]|nr:metallophosphoesterase [Deltaproteobacteria bacterium]